MRATVAEIDLDAIQHNLRQIRRIVGPSVRICAAVKADAYGHGAVEVSRAMAASGANVLSVATVEEAEELRKNGISLPLLMLGCTLTDDIPGIVSNEITATVCDEFFAEKLSSYALDKGRRVPVHLKVDTGMGRIGVQPTEIIELSRKVSMLPGIELEGIYTHLPSADEDDLTYTHGQIEIFKSVTDEIEKAGIVIPIRHVANSAALIRVTSAHFDMVRPGIILYGLCNDVAITVGLQIRQAMTLKTKVVFLKTLSAGCTIGYGRTYLVNRRMEVATIPIGYADGYSRHLSNRGCVLVHGRRAPIVGRICMDQTMIDVSDIDGIRVGDEVVVYGSQSNEEVTIDEVASLLGTIPYEVCCNLGRRVPRKYLGG